MQISWRYSLAHTNINFCTKDENTDHHFTTCKLLELKDKAGKIKRNGLPRQSLKFYIKNMDDDSLTANITAERYK